MSINKLLFYLRTKKYFYINGKTTNSTLKITVSTGRNKRGDVAEFIIKEDGICAKVHIIQNSIESTLIKDSNEEVQNEKEVYEFLNKYL